MYNLHDSYFDYSCYEQNQCNSCETKEKQLQIASDHFYGLIKILYSSNTLNMADLMDTLDELSHCLDITLPSGRPNITRI